MRQCILRRTRPLLLLLAACGTLAAGSPRLGLTAGGAWPCASTRDLYTDSAGWAVGAFADWEQRPGHAVRLALDGTFHPRSQDGRARTQALTLNYVLAPRGDLRGFYLVLGAGGMNVQKKTAPFLQETGVKLAWTAGFGVDLDDRWGVLARYHAVSSEGRNLGNLTAGLTWKF